MHRRFVFVFLAVLLFAGIFPISLFVPTVEAQGEGWLEGWQYRKSHVVNPVSGAGTNYQVRIKARWGEPAQEDLVPSSEIVSTLPIPSGTSIVSAQAAVYWDGTYLHVWYGATTGGDINDSIYYTKASSPFTNWSTPVQVIDRDDGIRDPTVFIEGDNIYLFCQCWNGTFYRPIRLYKISKTADFTNPSNYTYVGVVVDTETGTYDENMAASPCAVKIGSTYYLMYEAFSSDWTGSIGRAKSTNIESLPWTKDGQLRDTNGDVIYNPAENYADIVPDTFADQNTLFIHYYDGSHWNERYASGDFANNSVTLSDADINPYDSYSNHANVAHVGAINGVYYFLMQSWNNTIYLRLYASTGSTGDSVALHGHSRTDFGDVRFTDDDGVTALPYWMESKVDSDNAVFWVRIADDLSSSPATIYIYYGKNDAATTSNGDNTFLLFDDFLGNSLDSSKWTSVTKGNGGSVSVANGEVTLNPKDNTVSSASIQSVQTFTNSILIQIKRKYTAGTEDYLDTSLGAGSVVDADNGGTGDWWHTTLQSGYLWLYQTAYGVYEEIGCMPATGGRVVLTSGGGDLFDTSYRIHDLIYTSNGVLKWIVDGIQISNASDSNFLTNNKKILISQGEFLNGQGADTVIDYVLVRRYVDPEPSNGAWGNEEMAEPPVVIFTFSPANPKASEPVLFNASLSTSNCGTIVNYSWSFGDGNVTPTSNPTIVHAYNIPGTYNITLTISDSAGLSASTWNVVIVSSRIQTMISISTFASSKFVGFNVKINGTLADEEGNGLSGAIVVLSHTFPGIPEWIHLTSATTDALGNYDFTWIPPLTGQFTIKTEWAGNDTYAPASNTSTLNVITSEDGHVFSVASNSTVSALAFNSTDLQLGFTVTGPPGTTGFAQVTITKTLASNITDLKVYLDGNPLEFSTSSTEDSWIVYLNYTHSTHYVTIALNTTLGDTAMTPLTMAVLKLLAVLGVAGTNALAIRKLKPRFHLMHKSSNDKRLG